MVGSPRLAACLEFVHIDLATSAPIASGRMRVEVFIVRVGTLVTEMSPRPAAGMRFSNASLRSSRSIASTTRDR
ncbi:MAG: hypothetical protein ACE5GX_02455 [Thermoanaerobaculia bacterium]